MGGRAPDLVRWEAFLATRSKETQRIYRYAIALFCKTLGYRTLREAAEKGDESAVARFVSELQKQNIAPNTANLYVRAVVQFYRAIRRPLDPGDIRMFTPKRRVIRETNMIPADLAYKIVIAASRDKGLLLHFLWATGVRLGEATSIRMKDLQLDVDPPRVTVMTEKTYKPRIVFLPADLTEKVREHVRNLRPDDLVFHARNDPRRPLDRRRVGEALRRALRKVGELRQDQSGRGYSITPHSFRRGYETALAAAGVHPFVIKYLVGHSQGTEDHYLRLSESDLIREWRKAEPVLRLDQRKVFSKARELVENVTATVTVMALREFVALMAHYREAHMSPDHPQAKLVDELISEARRRIAEAMQFLGPEYRALIERGGGPRRRSRPPT